MKTGRKEAWEGVKISAELFFVSDEFLELFDLKVQEDSRGPHDPQTKLTLPKVPDSEVHANMEDDLKNRRLLF